MVRSAQHAGAPHAIDSLSHVANDPIALLELVSARDAEASLTSDALDSTSNLRRLVHKSAHVLPPSGRASSLDGKLVFGNRHFCRLSQFVACLSVLFLISAALSLHTVMALF